MVGNILDGVKAIKEIADATQNLELKSLIVDLKEQILDLREENLQLKSKLATKEDFNMEFDGRAYYNIKSDGVRDGPFCSACWDCDTKVVRLRVWEAPYGTMHTCPVCKNEYYVH